MPTQGMRELVGRAMVDAEFFDRLVRSPETVLAGYKLDDAERTTVLKALRRLASTPTKRRAGAFQAAMVRRLAT
jgi:hypothetical protein